MALKLGIVTPVVIINPRFQPPEWEVSGTIEDVVEVAKAADRIGIDWVSCSEHIVIPDAAADRRGGRYWDPLTTLSFMAAHTERVRLLTHVVVLPYHHPLELVKRYGTLDVASHGRVVLGIGVGTLEPEFELLGHPYEDRGDRSDDSIRAIRAAWGVEVPEYQGSHYSFSGFIVDPAGVPRHLPIWVGGRTRRSLRRAVELGDGWVPFGLRLEKLTAMLGDDRTRAMVEAREAPLDIVLAPESPLDPLGDPGTARKVLSDYQAIGATSVSLRFRHESRAHYLEQMAAVAEVAGSLDA